jgi:hypothetical protein
LFLHQTRNLGMRGFQFIVLAVTPARNHPLSPRGDA